MPNPYNIVQAAEMAFTDLSLGTTSNPLYIDDVVLIPYVDGAARTIGVLDFCGVFQMYGPYYISNEEVFTIYITQA